MAKNVRNMQQKYMKQYFNFIPESYVLPDERAKFEEAFEAHSGGA